MKIHCGACNTESDIVNPVKGNRDTTVECPNCNYRGACQIGPIPRPDDKRIMYQRFRKCRSCGSQSFISDAKTQTTTCAGCGIILPTQ